MGGNQPWDISVALIHSRASVKPPLEHSIPCTGDVVGTAGIGIVAMGKLSVSCPHRYYLFVAPVVMEREGVDAEVQPFTPHQLRTFGTVCPHQSSLHG